QHGNLNCDPVTGNFLLLSAGQLWELNPSGAGTWTQQTGTRVPPSRGGVPGPTNPQGVISAAIPQYRVVASMTQSATAVGTTCLWKPAWAPARTDHVWVSSGGGILFGEAAAAVRTCTHAHLDKGCPSRVRPIE